MGDIDVPRDRGKHRVGRVACHCLRGQVAALRAEVAALRAQLGGRPHKLTEVQPVGVRDLDELGGARPRDAEGDSLGPS